MIAPQVIEHVVHIHGLIYRPRRAVLLVREIGIRQVDLGIYAQSAVAPRKA